MNAANELQQSDVTNPNYFQYALAIAKHDIPVAFVPAGEKGARTSAWQDLATTSPELLREFAQANPGFTNIAAVAKAVPGGRLMLDDDDDILQEYEKVHGPCTATLTAQSCNGAYHYFFEHTKKSLAFHTARGKGYIAETKSGEKGERWSLRMHNAYVIAAGSIVKNDAGIPTMYQIVHDTPIAPLPDSLLDFLIERYDQSAKAKPKLATVPPSTSAKAKSTLVPDAPVLEGGRNNSIASETGRLWERGNKSQPEIEEAMLDWNAKWFQPPLDEKEVLATVASICKKPQGKPHGLLFDGKESGYVEEDYVGCDFIPGPELLSLPIGKSAPLKVVAPFVEPIITPEIQALLDAPDENAEAAIPPFDPSVINGIYAKFVDVVTRNTTLQPQFAYAIAKCIVGIKMAGKVTLETIDVEPRLYIALIGETGSGKGTAFRRIQKILEPEAAIYNAGIKISNSFDSGAGLKELFFAPPDNQPVLGFIDEICDLGNKSQEARNPGIIDTIITLADSTSFTRSLAKATRTKNDARLCMVMCGQNGLAYTKALAGRTQMGLWDRFYPEYGQAQETGDMPPINKTDAMNLLTELNGLDYSGTMKMSQEAKQLVDEFWKGSPAEVRKMARWKNFFQLDAYLSAFGRGVRVVEPSDVEIAIKIFSRQLVIRKVCFTTEIPDRIGYYLSRVTRITDRMIALLKKGVHPDLVAKSHRDYEKETNAHRDNETHIFNRAWQVHASIWLKVHKIKRSNGQEYTKFLPMDDER